MMVSELLEVMKMKKKYKLALIKIEGLEVCVDFEQVAKQFNISVARFKKHLNLLELQGYLEYQELGTKHKEVYDSLISNNITVITNIIKKIGGSENVL